MNTNCQVIVSVKTSNRSCTFLLDYFPVLEANKSNLIREGLQERDSLLTDLKIKLTRRCIVDD